MIYRPCRETIPARDFTEATPDVCQISLYVQSVRTGKNFELKFKLKSDSLRGQNVDFITNSAISISNCFTLLQLLYGTKCTANLRTSIQI